MSELLIRMRTIFGQKLFNLSITNLSIIFLHRNGRNKLDKISQRDTKIRFCICLKNISPLYFIDWLVRLALLWFARHLSDLDRGSL